MVKSSLESGFVDHEEVPGLDPAAVVIVLLAAVDVARWVMMVNFPGCFRRHTVGSCRIGFQGRPRRPSNPSRAATGQAVIGVWSCCAVTS